MDISNLTSGLLACCFQDTHVSTKDELDLTLSSSTKTLPSSMDTITSKSDNSSFKTPSVEYFPPPKVRQKKQRGLNLNNIRLKMDTENHGNHSHKILRDAARDRTDDNLIQADGEGCKCCVRAIDADEMTALSEAQHGSKASEDALVSMADLGSGSHWAIFSAAGVLAMFGITAAYRNIFGGLQNLTNISSALRTSKQNVTDSIQNSGPDSQKTKKLKGIRRGLRYSKFDTKWNIAVPGVVNGAASTTLVTTGLISHPFALPLLGLYSMLQATRGIYDTVRFWNFKLEPVPDEARDKQTELYNAGVRKMNRITSTKRLFYPGNAFAFAALSVGATLLFLSAPGIAVFAGASLPLVIGVCLLGFGSLVTAFTNNRWTNKFRPRNGDIGLDRANCEPEDFVRAVGERREMKKILIAAKKDLFADHKSKFRSFNFKRNGWQLLAILPFTNEKAAQKNHNLSKQEIDFLFSKHKDLDEQLLSVASSLKDTCLPTRIQLQAISLNSKFTDTVHTLRELGLLNEVLKNYINEYHMPTVKETRKQEGACKSACCKGGKLETQLNLLAGFQRNGEEWLFNPQKFEQGNESDDLERFNKAIAFTLLCTEPEKLRYEQYGAEAAYWNLKWAN